AAHGPVADCVLSRSDGCMEWGARAGEVSVARCPRRVAVPVQHVPAVAVFEQFRVVVIAFGPGTFPRTYTHLGPVGGRGTVGGWGNDLFTHAVQLRPHSSSHAIEVSVLDPWRTRGGSPAADSVCGSPLLHGWMPQLVREKRSP